MEEENTGVREALLSDCGSKKGGFRTIPFIIANEAFEKVASYGLSSNMILYLMDEYHLGMTSSSNILYLWSSATNLFPVIGAYFADSFVGRYRMIAYGSIFSFLGTIILWLTAVIPQARPSPCVDSTSNYCISPTTFQLVFLCSSFLLMSIGAGGIRSASMAFGADQLQDAQTLQKTGAMETYLSWYNSMTALSVVIAMTCIVYIQEIFGWNVGFGVPVVLMFLSTVSFFLATSFYVKSNPKSSLITGLVQVVAASYKKRNMVLPSTQDGYDLLDYHNNDSLQVVPTEKLRFLNKSCIIEDPKEDLNPDGSPSNPWRLCRVDQVEDLKKLITLIPLWSTGIIMSVNVGQQSFPILQANSMNRHITKNFQIPAASFSMVMMISLVAWVLIYDRILIPVTSRIMGRPSRLSPITRMGIGIVFSFLSMMVRAMVEGVRRSMAIREGFIDNPKGIVTMSAFWLLPQNALMGIGEAFNIVGQMELYLSELPSGMSSISTSLAGIGTSFGGLLAGLIMNTIDGVTKSGGNESWISNNINRGRYDYYYFVLAGLCMANAFYFLVCSRIYRGSRMN